LQTEPVLAFSPAIDPAVYNMNCGDGVEFIIEAQAGNGKIQVLYDRYIDPKHNVAERRWLDERIDLSRYDGKPITLLFSTSGGPRGNTACDWAGWGDLRFTGRAPAQAKATGIHEIYNNEVTISEYDKALPRASVFYSVDLVQSDDAALRRVQDPALDVWRRVVLVSPSSKDKAVQRTLQKLSAEGGVPAQPASIVSYDSRRVIIHATLEQSGIVMLTDSNYPGWNAYLDGRHVALLSANYLFRGVLVPTGTHIIEFRYEPRSYFYGCLISLGALLLAVAWTLGSSEPGRRYRIRLISWKRTQTARV